MSGQRAYNYLMWLVMMAGAMLIPVMIYLVEGFALASDPNGYNIGFHAMATSFVILAMTTFLGAALAYPDAKDLPAWTLGVLIYVFVGLFTILALSESFDRTSAVSFAYIPGAIFCSNVVLTFLIQTWAAGEGAKLSMWMVLPTHGLFAFWTLCAPIYVANTAFTAFSASGVVVTLLVCIPLVIVAAKRMMAEKAERQRFIEWQMEHGFYN